MVYFQKSRSPPFFFFFCELFGWLQLESNVNCLEDKNNFFCSFTSYNNNVL